MALGTTFIDDTNVVDAFIPELWSDEILDALEHKLVMADLVNNSFSEMVKNKGDTIHIPIISNLTANTKSVRAPVTVQSPGTESTRDLTVDSHREVSFLVEDLGEIQTSINLRSIYTRRAGYAIANEIDGDLITVAQNYFDTIDSTTNANTGTLSEDDIILAKTILDENDCPAEDRHIVVSPQQYNKLLQIERFTEARMLGPQQEREIRRGVVGMIHGFYVWMTQQLAASGTATTDTVDTLVFHRDALALVMQLAPRVQANYLPEYLGWLVTVDTVYGMGELRDDWGLVISNDAITYSFSETGP